MATASDALKLAKRGIPVFPLKPDKTPYTPRGFHDATADLDAVTRYWERHPDALIGVPTGEVSGLCVLDIDRKGGVDGSESLRAKNWGVPLTRTHATKSGGVHYLFHCPAGKKIKSTAGKLGAGVDSRGEGGYIVWWPAEGLDVPCSEELADVPDWLTAALAEPVSNKPTAPAGAVIPNGQRNSTLTRMAGALRRVGATAGDIEAALFHANASRCTPPLDESEVRHIAASVARYEPASEGQAAPDKPSRFPLTWITDVPSTLGGDYIIKGVVGRGELALVYGESGSGKTFFGLDLAAHAARGGEWRGKRIRPGVTIYIAAEAGASIYRRFVAWQRAHNPEHADIPLAIVPTVCNLLDEREAGALVSQLMAIAKERGDIALVVFDTLSRSTPGGDENSAADMTAAVRVCDQLRDLTGAATLLIHHGGKDRTKGPRGHSSLKAAADTVILVEDKCAVIEKARDGETGEQFPFDLEVVNLGTDNDGDAITTCIVRPREDGAQRIQTAKLPESELDALSALHEVIEGHGEQLPHTSTIPGAKRGVRVDLWRDRFALCYGEDRSDDATRVAFKRAKDNLIKKKVVGASTPWVWVW